MGETDFIAMPTNSYAPSISANDFPRPDPASVELILFQRDEMAKLIQAVRLVYNDPATTDAELYDAVTRMILDFSNLSPEFWPIPNFRSLIAKGK